MPDPIIIPACEVHWTVYATAFVAVGALAATVCAVIVAKGIAREQLRANTAAANLQAQAAAAALALQRLPMAVRLNFLAAELAAASDSLVDLIKAGKDPGKGYDLLRDKMIAFGGAHLDCATSGANHLRNTTMTHVSAVLALIDEFRGETQTEGVPSLIAKAEDLVQKAVAAIMNYGPELGSLWALVDRVMAPHLQRGGQESSSQAAGVAPPPNKTRGPGENPGPRAYSL